MTLKAILALGGTFVSFLIGAWHISLGILCVFMVIDYITGMAKGAMAGELNSMRGFRGILKKGIIMLVIILANMLDLLVGGALPVFRSMAVYFYIGNEGVSILENLGKLGVPIPDAIRQYIDSLSEGKKKQPEEIIQKKLTKPLYKDTKKKRQDDKH